MRSVYLQYKTKFDVSWRILGHIFYFDGYLDIKWKIDLCRRQKSANCMREILEIVNTCQSEPNSVTVNSSQYIFFKLLHW